MNHSPWYVNNAASYEQQRIRHDMKQIRLEQKALKAEAGQKAASAPKPATLQALRHATVVVTEAVLAILT